MLPDLLGPMVRPPAAPSISTLVIFRFGATMELGRSGGPMMMPRRFGAARATGSASPRPDRNSSLGFFIPWRVVAEESGGAHFGFGGAMLLDLPGPALRLLTDVADFHFTSGDAVEDLRLRIPQSRPIEPAP
jgi:hypothetical protein